MSTTDKFNEWYERLKSMVAGSDGPAPGERKGEELDRCVRQVKNQGHDEDSAYAICNASLKAGVTDKSERYELLDTAKAITDYPGEVPGAFEKLIDYAGLESKSEEELELPKVCRKCEDRTRIKGNFMCPECHPDVDPEADDYELVGSPVTDSGSDGEGEDEKADEEGPQATRKVYLDHGVSNAPEDAIVRADEKGLYYEETVDVDAGADQKADPMANGHDLDPETGRGTCEATGKEIEAETMGDLTEDCPHCGDALSVFDQKAAAGDGEFSADLIRLTAAEDDDTDYNGNVLGIGIVFPEAGVYVDWRREAFPDQLEHPHVSEYGSVEDLQQATGNDVEVVETYEAGVDVKQKLDLKAVPDGAVSISDESEAPEDAQIVRGDRGGLYYVPAGEGDDEEGEDGGGEFEPGEELDAGDLEEGMEVSIYGDPATINGVYEDAGPSGETAIAFTNDATGEDFEIFEDLLEGEIEATEATGGSGGGEADGDPGGEGGEDGDAEPADGEETEELMPDDVTDEHVGRSVSFEDTRGGPPVTGELVAIEDRPGQNDEGEQLVVQGDSFVPSRIPREHIAGDVQVGGPAEPDTGADEEPADEPEEGDADGGDEGEDEDAGDTETPEDRWDAITQDFGADQDVPESVDVSQAESVSSLEDLGIEGGQDEAAMRVAEMPDGSRAFVRDGEAMKQDPEAAAAAGNFLDALGANVAQQHYDPETDALAVEEVDGQLMSEVEPGEVDEDSFYDAVAASMLAGNADLHDANLMVGDDGEVTLFDLDRAGGRLFPSGDEEQEVSQELWQDQDVAHFYTREAAHDQGFDAEDPMQEVQERVQGMQEEAATVAEALPDNDAGDAIRQNIEQAGKEDTWL